MSDRLPSIDPEVETQIRLRATDPFHERDNIGMYDRRVLLSALDSERAARLQVEHERDILRKAAQDVLGSAGIRVASRRPGYIAVQLERDAWTALASAVDRHVDKVAIRWGSLTEELVERLPASHPLAGKTSDYCRYSEPHTMAECPFAQAADRSDSE